MCIFRPRTSGNHSTVVKLYLSIQTRENIFSEPVYFLRHLKKLVVFKGSFVRRLGILLFAVLYKMLMGMSESPKAGIPDNGDHLQKSSKLGNIFKNSMIFVLLFMPNLNKY